MSARIVVNLAHGLASIAVTSDLDGGTWLSVWHPDEVVAVKLSRASAHTLWLELSKVFGTPNGVSPAPEEGERPASPSGEAAGSPGSRRPQQASEDHDAGSAPRGSVSEAASLTR